MRSTKIALCKPSAYFKESQEMIVLQMLTNPKQKKTKIHSFIVKNKSKGMFAFCLNQFHQNLLSYTNK